VFALAFEDEHAGDGLGVFAFLHDEIRVNRMAAVALD
jgi:hypothetical protein